MATVTKKRAKDAQTFGSVPYGNISRLLYRLETNSSGAMVNSDSTSALAISDVARVGLVPAGFRLDDMQVIVSNAFPASCTCSVGFAYKDGVDDTSVPQSASFFGSGIALSSAARIRSSASNAPVVLPKDAWLIVTIAGAAVNEVGIADFLINGEQVGI